MPAHRPSLPACPAVGIEADSDRVDKLISEMEGKDIEDVISQGLGKLASVPAGGGGGGGGGGAAAGGGGGGGAGGALGCTAGLSAVAGHWIRTGVWAALLTVGTGQQLRPHWALSVLHCWLWYSGRLLIPHWIEAELAGSG